MDLKPFLHPDKEAFAKLISHIFRNLLAVYIILLTFNYVSPGYIEFYIDLDWLLYPLIVIGAALLTIYMQNLEISNKAGFEKIKRLISCVFLVMILIITIQSFASELMIDWMMPLVLTVVVLGVVTFYLDRDKLDAIEEEARQEELEEKKRVYKEVWYNIVLVGIIILSLILRFNGISTLDYWVDEFYSMVTAQSILDGTFPILPSGAENHRAIVYFHMLAGSIKLFGFNQFAGRFLNLIFTCLTIYTLYLIGHHLFDRLVGIISAFLFSISPLAIHLAREIRMYEMTTFLSLVTIGLGYIYINKFNKLETPIKNFFKDKINIMYLSFYILLLFLTFDTHITTVAFFFSFYVYFLYSYFIKQHKQYKIFVYIIPIMLPFLIIIAYKSLNLVEGFLFLTETIIGSQRPVWASTYVPLNWHILNLVNNSGSISIVYVGLFCSMLLIVYSKYKRDKLIFLILMIFIPLALISIARLGVERYSYFLLPLFILYISAGIVTIYKLISPIIFKVKYFNIILILALTGLIVLNMQIGYDASNNPPWAKKVNFERANEIINENYDKNTTLIYNSMAAPLEAYNTKANYFFIENGIQFLDENGNHMLLGTKYLKFDEFKEYIRNNNNIIVAIRPWPTDITSNTFIFLNQNMKRIDDRNTSIIIYYK
ncbi:MAG: hypothetical protein FIB07_18005 [Candidatus Methanoperedens sp.]|nr:hypothetical protein [Candidatus Methanoperedens sp.]